MDFLEDMGGCVTLAIIAIIVLLLAICVAIVFFGVALTDLTGG